MTVYVLKNQLKEPGYAANEEEAYHRWNQCYQSAEQSGLAPLKRFAKRLGRYHEGTIVSTRYRLSTGILEAMTNRIKVIKRMAYGYRETEYLFLKIKATFPGKA